jgi:hypothetical protein
LVISTDANEAARMKAAIVKNATALDVEIKGVGNHTIDKVAYLVVDIIIQRSETDLAAVMVRPSKIERWSESKLEDEDSCRRYASFAGRAVFMASLVHPNLQLSSIGQRAVKLAWHIGKQASKRVWGAVIPRPPGLKALWNDVLSCREGHFVCSQRVATSGTFQSCQTVRAACCGPMVASRATCDMSC